MLWSMRRGPILLEEPPQFIFFQLRYKFINNFYIFFRSNRIFKKYGSYYSSSRNATKNADFSWMKGGLVKNIKLFTCIIFYLLWINITYFLKKLNKKRLSVYLPPPITHYSTWKMEPGFVRPESYVQLILIHIIHKPITIFDSFIVIKW